MSKLHPGWAEKHVPVKGSQRAYSPLSRLHVEDGRGPAPTPSCEISRQDVENLRALAKLERSFR